MADVVDLKVRVKQITVSDGTILDLDEDDIVVVVGPNNAGKSQFLRDIEGHLSATRSTNYNGKVVTSLSLAAPAKAEFEDALQKYKELDSEYFNSFGIKFHKNALIGLSDTGGSTKLGNISPFFVKRISADDRLSVVTPSAAMSERGPETPAQILYDNQSLLTEVSSIFRSAFGKDLFFDYRSGAQIPIYAGQIPILPKGCDRVSDEYVKLVRSCDKLHEQGDGMKSFGGILLSTLTVKFNITLIDEPEAFLHPPQERIIGRIISEQTSGQVFCATHSKDVLQGLLESSGKNVRVVRVTRSSGKNHVSEIAPREVRELWQDPIFRYSTALDGLFHDRVVLCEADPDCKFYEAIEASLGSSRGLDSHFVPCGGKAAFPKFIRALSGINIPVVAILDIDVLNDKDIIRRIYEAQGGAWSEIFTEWRQLDAAVRKGIPADTIDNTKSRILSILEAWDSGAPPTSSIMEALKQTKPWGKVKENGLAGVPPGNAQRVAELLIEKLNGKGVFPVPVGTLENFVRTVGNHGIKWLNEVFANYRLDDPKLLEARNFIRLTLG